MPKEIENKFLVTNNIWRAEKSEKYFIRQGYISNDQGQKVRVRVKVGHGGTLTIKGRGEIIEGKIVREEIENEISEEIGMDLLSRCNKVLEKTRHIIMYKNTKIEVDDFHNLKKPLVIAEIEYLDPKDVLELPNWLGEDVTINGKYTNIRLIEQVVDKNTQLKGGKKTIKKSKKKTLSFYKKTRKTKTDMTI